MRKNQSLKSTQESSLAVVLRVVGKTSSKKDGTSVWLLKLFSCKY